MGNPDRSILPKEKIIADLCSRESKAVLDFQNGRLKTKGLTAKKMIGKVLFINSLKRFIVIFKGQEKDLYQL